MSDPAAVKAAESFKSQLASASEAQILAMGRRWQGVESNLTAIINDLAEEIAALTEAGEAVPAWKLYQMERYQSLIAQIGGELSKYMNWAIVQMGDDAKKAQALARSHAAEMLSIQGEGKTGVLETALDKLQAGAAEKITGLAQAGNPLDAILKSAYPTAVNAITDKLITGAALGWNPKKTVAQILRGGGLDQALNHIMLVSRDQQIRNYRETQRDAYKASSVVYGYMRLARKAKRTCMACLALDGTIYPTNEVMQLHPQDRCSMIPLVVGRPVPSWTTGLEWFKKQDAADQREMLGPQRYRLWKDGLFDLEQIVTVKENPTWGPSAQVTSAKILKAGGGGVSGRTVWAAPDLLKIHTVNQAGQSKEKTINLSENAAILAELKAILPKSPLPLHVKVGINNVLKKAATGDSAYTYVDSEGKLAGAVSWKTKQDNQFFTEITGAGFIDAATNKKALLDVGAAALAEGRGILATVPTSLIPRYLDWGFAITKGGKDASTMTLGGDDLPKFLANPEAFGTAKKQAIVDNLNTQLLDPKATAVFRSGYALPETGYKITTLEAGEIAGLKKALPDSKPLVVPEGKHAAAGMILIDPKTGKMVLVNPAGGFGGAKVTVPKGTVEEGEDYQAAAIREVFEETGFKAKVIGLLGDYEKSTSMNRFYIGYIEDGAPWGGHFETEAVQLVPIEGVRDLVDTGADKGLLKDFETLHKQALEKGGGDLEKGLDLIAGEKAESDLALSDAQLNALADWIEGRNVTIDSLKLAVSGVKKHEPVLEDKLRSDLASLIAAEAEAKTKARAENEKSSGIISAFLSNGPDSLAAVRTSELRTAVAWAYENGITARDIADLEAIQTTRLEAKALKAVVPLPDSLSNAPKNALIAHLVTETGATSWKLKQLTGPQISALFGQSKAAILQAAEDGAAKYYNAKAAKLTPPPPDPRPADRGIYLPQSVATKSQQVGHFVEATAVAKWKLNQLTASEIAALSGKTKAEILEAGEQGAAKYYAAKGKPKPTAETPAAKAERGGESVTEEIAKDRRALAAFVGVSPSAITGDTKRFEGMGRAEVVEELIQEGDAALAKSTFIDWMLNPPSFLDGMNTSELQSITAYINSPAGQAAGVNAAYAADVAKALAQKTAPITPVQLPKPKGADDDIFGVVSDAAFKGESLAGFSLNDLKTALTVGVAAFGAKEGVVVKISQAIAEKEGIAPLPNETAAVAQTFPAPTGKTANSYVEQLVITGQFSAGDILEQVKATYPKSIFTLANVEGKFKKLGVAEPVGLAVASSKQEPTTPPPPPIGPPPPPDNDSALTVFSYGEKLILSGNYTDAEILKALNQYFPEQAKVWTVDGIADWANDKGVKLPVSSQIDPSLANDAPTPKTYANKQGYDDLNEVLGTQLDGNKIDTYSLDTLKSAWSFAVEQHGEAGALKLTGDLWETIQAKEKTPAPPQPSADLIAQGKELYQAIVKGEAPKGMIDFIKLKGVGGLKSVMLYANSENIPMPDYMGKLPGIIQAIQLPDGVEDAKKLTVAQLKGLVDSALKGKGYGHEQAIKGATKAELLTMLDHLPGAGTAVAQPMKGPAVFPPKPVGEANFVYMANLARTGNYTAKEIYAHMKATFPTYPLKLKSVAAQVDFFASEAAKKAAAATVTAKTTVAEFPPKSPTDLNPKIYLAKFDTSAFTASQLATQVNKLFNTTFSADFIIEQGIPFKAATAVPVEPKQDPPPPPTPQPIGKGTANVTGLSEDLFTELNLKSKASFSGATLTGASKALYAISQGQSGLVYYNDQGGLAGVVSFQSAGSVLKLTGAAFADQETNAKAVADALQKAGALGVPLETWVPAPIQAQYKAWGFKNKTSSYFALSLAEASPDLLKNASEKITTQTDVSPVPLPPNAADMTAAGKLSKADLVSHISIHGGVAKAKLEKLDKGELLALIGTNPSKLVDAIITKKEQEAAFIAPFTAWQKGAKVTSASQGKKILEYINLKGLNGATTDDVEALRARVEALIQEEKDNAPFTPRFEARPAPSLPAAAKLPTHKDFPSDTSGLKTVKRLGGSTGAELVEDASGRRFVMKKGANEGHLLEEAYSDAAYQAAGLNVPRFQIYNTPNGPIKLAEYIPGKSLAEAIKGADSKERRAVLEQVRAGFAVDALMGNWDVLGQDMDNILVDESGKVWRIDNGGSLRFRAMGSKKTGDDWNQYATDIWSMREAGRGGAAENNARIFGDLDIYEIMDQARGVVANRDAMLAAVPAEARDILYQRFEYLRDMVEVSDMVRKDKFTADHTETFLRESTYLRQAGLVDALPDKLSQTSAGSVIVKDAAGNAFDSLRGPKGHIAAVAKYMKENGGNMNMISEWMGAQAGDSWNDAPRAMKYARALARGGNFSDYWWKDTYSEGGLEASKKAYDNFRKKYGAETFDKTLAIWQAFTYESLRKMDFEHNRPDGGYLELVRTENSAVISAYNLKESYTQPTTFKRGPAESGSIYATVNVFGNELTLQRVPWHRVWGYYFQSRGEGYEGAFLGEKENEFVFDGEGLPTYYVGKVGAGRSIESYWKKVGD